MKRIYFLSFLFISSWNFGQDYNVASIPESLRANANAVIREHSQDYTVKSVNEMLIKETKAVTIMSSAGDQYSTISI